MGYCGCMGYGMYFPANQLGGPKKLWGIREYGLSGLWVTRESTVCGDLAHRNLEAVFTQSYFQLRVTCTNPCNPLALVLPPERSRSPIYTDGSQSFLPSPIIISLSLCAFRDGGYCNVQTSPVFLGRTLWSNSCQGDVIDLQAPKVGRRGLSTLILL
jgi:hypothetical protein